jgi:hypothetical protein
MENLKSLMHCLDDISKLIPEGTYLEMCDNLKKVHDTIPKHADPPTVDNRRVPFQVVLPGQVEVHRLVDDESDDESLEDLTVASVEVDAPEWYDEWVQNEECLRRLLDDMKVAERSFRALKPIQRITKKIREDALRSYCRQANFYPTEMTEWTFEKFAQIATRHNWPENSRNRRFERTIYENYRIFENRQIERRRNEITELKGNLESEISDLRDRQAYLRVHYNL